MFPVGGQLALEGRNLSTLVFETGLPARIDSYGDASGPAGVTGRESCWVPSCRSRSIRRAANPLLPPRLVLDRNRGGAYLAVLLIGAGMFGIFLFLTYYLQTTLEYSPVATGVAFLPTIAMVMLFSQVSNIVLMPRTGPRPLVGAGMLVAAAGMAWLTRIGVHSGYAATVLGPLLLTGAFWWTAGIFAVGGIVCGSLLRRGPLVRQAEAAPPGVKAQQHEPALPAPP